MGWSNNIEENAENSDEIKKIRYAGVCNYNVEQMQEAEKYLTLVSDQVPYSTVKRNIEKDVVPSNDFLKKIKPIADERGISLGQLVILWTLEQPGITIALVGARNAEQAVQNARATEVSLSSMEIETISQELDQLVLMP